MKNIRKLLKCLPALFVIFSITFMASCSDDDGGLANSTVPLMNKWEFNVGESIKEDTLYDVMQRDFKIERIVLLDVKDSVICDVYSNGAKTISSHYRDYGTLEYRNDEFSKITLDGFCVIQLVDTDAYKKAYTIKGIGEEKPGYYVELEVSVGGLSTVKIK